MPSEIYCLGFDTSAAHCAAALLRDGELLDSRLEEMGKGQAERLMPMMIEMLDAHGLTWSDLAVIGVGTGPGNFTGVRIAVSAARGLALSLGVPAVGVSLFEARAYGLPRPLAVVEDARRGDVYLQIFREAEPAGEAPQLLPLAEAAALVEGFALTGTASESAYALASDAMNINEDRGMPIAEAIARLAEARRLTPQLRPAPLYLRAADAAPPSDPPPVILP
ncbi:tRNA (adenosine(37)-N6)-threonylcarbamoyltransferase complex dimerization subunit type 1 TsaB [Albirhodobacter sp. R86504]|uniref:tRNA (adenosine(37)-N6)-threonylcarbamoyltransferase complex dimerization subunit type 1 TsaB n=1 Tax=Albirhodobacter sp. R86504 TaxID=3093848 RepID=UPI00366F1DDF